MGTDVKAELHIPDLWYDFYARLLPGLLFVFAVRYFYFDEHYLPKFDEMVFLVVAAYFCGIYSQQVSSRLTQVIYWLMEKLTRTATDYIWSIQKRIGLETNGAKILDKMHGEVVFFVQVFLLSTVTYVFSRVACDDKIPSWFLLVAVVSLAFAFEVVKRRIERAEKLETISPETTPASH